MSLCDESFLEFVHPLQLRLAEKNCHFRLRYGSYSNWKWDPDLATLTFSEPGECDLEIDVTLVGTSVENSWEWSWSNPNVGAALKRDMDEVRAFGELHNYETLTSPFLECDPDTGLEMTAVAAHLLDAQGSYHFSTGESDCYLIYRAIREIPIEAESKPLALDLDRIVISDKGWDLEPESLRNRVHR